VELSGALAAERLRVVRVAEEERHRLARDLPRWRRSNTGKRGPWHRARAASRHAGCPGRDGRPGAAPRAAPRVAEGPARHPLRVAAARSRGRRAGGPPHARWPSASTVRMGRAWSRVASMRPGDLLRRWKRARSRDPRSGQQRDQTGRAAEVSIDLYEDETRSSRWSRTTGRGSMLRARSRGTRRREPRAPSMRESARLIGASCRSTRVRVRDARASQDPLRRPTIAAERRRSPGGGAKMPPRPGGLRRGLRALSDGIVLTDADGLVMSANPAAFPHPRRGLARRTVFEELLLVSGATRIEQIDAHTGDARVPPRGAQWVFSRWLDAAPRRARSSYGPRRPTRGRARDILRSASAARARLHQDSSLAQELLPARDVADRMKTRPPGSGVETISRTPMPPRGEPRASHGVGVDLLDARRA